MKKLKMLPSIKSYDLKFNLALLLVIFSILEISAKSFDNKISVALKTEKNHMQQSIVTGKVTNEAGEILPGASIQVKGTSIGVETDFDGIYAINIPENGTATLIFTYLGYVSKEVLVADQTVINVKLAQNNTSLEEVIVVGYGSQRKKDLVGAISQVKGDDLVLSSTPSIAHALQGKAAGLQIIQNSAQPGGGLDIRIRGAASINASNEPLIVVDGFPISQLTEPGDGNRYSGGTQGILNSFNPNDIESIEVLKDASSTAIYGARAANGVVIITTKKGKAGKVQVDYSTSYSYQAYENNYDVLNAPEYMQLRNEAVYENWAFLNRVAPYSNRTLQDAIANPVNGIPFTRVYSDDQINNASKGTDWFDIVTRDGGIQQHNISLKGGTESTKYYLSGNLFEHKGVLKSSEFERASLRFNLNQKFNDKISIGLSFTKSTINNQNTQLGGQAFENSGIIRSALQYSPLIDEVDSFGNYPTNPDYAIIPNPASLLTISDEARTDRTLANVYLEVKPLKGLTLRTQAGIDQGLSVRNTYLPRTTLWGENENGRASIASEQKNDKLLDITLNYKANILEDHSLNLLAGYSHQNFESSGNSLANNDFITDAFLWNNMNAGAGVPDVSSSKSTSKIVSYFGRLNYIYKDRYILTSTIRRDGSSNFSENNKFAIFPSMAIGWNIAEEPFMKSLKGKVSQLKLRYGYGQTGNADIGGNAFASYFAKPAYLNPDESVLVGVFASRLANPSLKWETTTEKNLGLDFGFFKNRVSGSVELFDKEISDLLSLNPINSYNEINQVWANIGKTQSRGIEFTLNTVNIQTKNFTWKSTFTYSTFDDRWLERAPDWKPAVYENVDDPIRAQFSYLSDGIMQAGEVVTAQPDLFPGQIKLKDVNGYLRDGSGNPIVDENGIFQRTGEADGKIDEADIVLLGSSDPDFIAGFSNMITYKNFQLNFHFNAMFGREIIDATDFTYGVSTDGVAKNGANALRNILNRWTPENPSTTRPGSNFGYSLYDSGDFFLQDAWFIRLSNISLSYQFPKNCFGKHLSSAALRVGGQNIFVITPYKGVDPETNGYDPDVSGDTSNLVASYPNVRTFTVGLDLKF
ncbi:MULTISPECIES: SusC/RagA family TonB-linked outer membrane protein [unclassified Cellulophaga]|uniref:SusC/RagA family TonB-linked outer membrane protein n=1 Tax=unclassified Cellulophaga TaxID=2634405 RepID=UPI0018E218AB|nr:MULTISPECIES: TonB-dependent receptor [unclassified Cellulophaga]MDO6492238.1 TonB-dependent receptor [Cellulophaga sp. 2_MG-2023]MDO6493188.1 TonB-dependent receptor [Cellulophaga sp. 3_MG-2023]